jgi:4-hydroxy-2-oxoheptanedioate aldolase
MPYDKFLEVGRDGRAPSLRQKLANGKPLLGLFLQYANPSLMELAGYLGYDWAFIDAEHGSVSVEAVENMVRGAEHANITPIVRVPSADPMVIQSYLDTGAMGILVPHLSSAKMARDVVACTKYPPHGTRGAGSKTRANNVGYRLTATDHFAWCNEQVVILGMLEDKVGVDNLAEILTVDGLDGLVIGPTDLAGSMGLPGQNHHPEVQALVERITKQIVSSSKLACRVLTKEDTAISEAERLSGLGVQMLVEGFMQVFARGARGTLALHSRQATGNKLAAVGR